MKVCKTCQLEKPLGEFYKSRVLVKSRGSVSAKFVIHPNCKICVRQIRQGKATNARNASLMAKYGIGLADYNRMFEQQNGLCGICANRSNGQPLSVDHDHRTGKVRGLLCQPCNLALGLFRDNPHNLMLAFDYLLTHSEVLKCL